MKNLFYSICSSFRSFSRRLKLAWCILKRDKDYDGAYLYQLLYIKLSNMVDYFEIDGIADMGGNIDKIKYCRDICKHLMKCEDYPEHINTKNSIRFFDNRSEIELNNKYALEDYYDLKAKKLLFGLMDTYIETWWD